MPEGIALHGEHVLSLFILHGPAQCRVQQHQCLQVVPDVITRRLQETQFRITCPIDLAFHTEQLLVRLAAPGQHQPGTAYGSQPDNHESQQAIGQDHPGNAGRFREDVTQDSQDGGRGGDYEGLLPLGK